MYLLDTNLLIALLDEAHEFHTHAKRWFSAERSKGWSTCPIVENGVVRILSAHSYPSGPLKPETVIQILHELTKDSAYSFVPDDVRLSQGDLSGYDIGLTRNALTDSYLTELSFRHGLSLATLDQKLARRERPPDRTITLVPA